MENEKVAGTLEHVAQMLESLDENRFRAASYRKAADTVGNLDEEVAEMLARGGREALENLPGIGSKLSGAIEELVTTGRLPLEEELEGRMSPGSLFTKVPGIGEELAGRIARELDVKTLEELEEAAHDGRLESVEGIGSEKAEGVRNSLAGMLSRSSRRRRSGGSSQGGDVDEPPVSLLLELDSEYRKKAENNELRKIAPKRFNPDDEKWLPVMNTQRQEWDFTVLFSNTKRAHRLQKTRDWVVIYYRSDGSEDQCTVVTAGRGKLEGRRVIRGRESECRRYYGL